MVDPNQNWRNEEGLSSFIIYKKKFAWLRIICSDGSSVWLRNYYRKYKTWNTTYVSGLGDSDYGHTDIEDITEDEYIIRKLSGNL